jgi:hypothetical protein
MRYLLIVFALLALPVTAVRADVSVSIGIAVPGARIGINVPAYPRLVQVPGYPVYYDPYVSLNMFFYDGVYWVFAANNWYMSTWYNGPWYLVSPYDVPLYVLRVPVRYYRVPPPFFYGWRPDAAPRWDEHWGHEWRERRGDWDRRSKAPPPRAPLPSYQKHYYGDRYPGEREQQREIRSERYRYEPRERVTKEYYQSPPGQQKKQRDGKHGH